MSLYRKTSSSNYHITEDLSALRRMQGTSELPLVLEARCQPGIAELESGLCQKGASEDNRPLQSPYEKPTGSETLDPTEQQENSKAPASSRAFKGDWRYVELYNSHVKQFFSLDYPGERKKGMKRKLEDSKITTERAYYRPEKIPKLTDEPDSSVNGTSRDDLADLSVGTLWTANEKDIFFRCLARFTIHRVSEFLEHLPRKSEGEIIAYYELLKRELEYHKVKETHSVQLREKGSTAPFLRHKYDIVTVPGGIDYFDIPTACEVSDEWVEYEEEQSIHIADRQQRLDTDRGKAQARHMKLYFGSNKDISTNEELPLLNVETAYNVSKIYRGNQITMIQEKKSAPRLIFESAIFFEEIIRLTTRRIIASLALGKFYTSFDGCQLIDVTSNDIWTAVRDSKIFEERKLGGKLRKKAESGILEAYWANIDSSLNLVTDNQFPRIAIDNTHDDGPADNDLGVMIVPQNLEAEEYPDHLIEDGACGKFDTSDSNHTDEDEDEENENFALGYNWDAFKDVKGHKRGRALPFYVEFDLAALDTPQGYIGSPKGVLDICIDDELILEETEALEAQDKEKADAIAEAAMQEFDGCEWDVLANAQISDSADEDGNPYKGDQKFEVVCLPSLRDSWKRHFALY